MDELQNKFEIILTKREEDLDRGICPDLDFEQLGPVGLDIESDSLHGSGKRQSTDQEDGQDEIGEEGGEVDDLAEALHAFQQSEEDDGPGQSEAEHELGAEASNVLDAGGDLKHVETGNKDI